jgi:hypothetical protein
LYCHSVLGFRTALSCSLGLGPLSPGVPARSRAASNTLTPGARRRGGTAGTMRRRGSSRRRTPPVSPPPAPERALPHDLNCDRSSRQIVSLSIAIEDLDVPRTVAGLHQVVEQMLDAESELCYDAERLAERLADAARAAGLYEPGRQTGRARASLPRRCRFCARLLAQLATALIFTGFGIPPIFRTPERLR